VIVGEGEWIGWPGGSLEDEDEDAASAPAIAVNDAGQAIAAARAGMGRARVPALLVAGMIEAGMIEKAGEIEPSRRGYWLVAPRPQWRQKKVQALVAALTAG
jgi:LysR family glycine cleavage system transcriptional activator